MNQSQKMMSGSAYKLIEADWIISVECTYAADGSRVWEYLRSVQEDQPPEDWDWTANWMDWLDGKPSADDKKWAGRITLSRRATNLKEKIQSESDSRHFDYRFDEIINKSILVNWLCDKKIEYLPIPDEGACILFDHVVASHSTSSIVSINSIVNGHRITEIRGLRPRQPSWYYSSVLAEGSDCQISGWLRLLGHYLLSFPEMFFRDKKTLMDFEKCMSTLKTLRQRTEISVLKYVVGKNSCRLQLRFVAAVCSYMRGALCDCLPIPGPPIKRKSGDPEEPVGVYSPEVVISSPVVQSALHSLSNIWQDKAHAILISSPPGSGKELFAQSIPYGSGIKKHDDGKRIPTISLANGLPSEQERQILGYQQDDGSIVDGLLAKANGAAMFIDEAHYPLRESGVRASLLRPLEAKEYYPVKSLKLRRADDVQWIFASSLPLEGKDSLSKVPPDDFWTRMTHQIRIEHPLDRHEFMPDGASWPTRIWPNPETTERQKKAVADLFKFFWWDRTESHFGIKPVKVLMEKEKTESYDLRTEDVAEQLFHGYIQTLLKQAPLDKIAELFAAALMKEVGGKSLTDVSIRGLRSMVSRIFSECVGLVTSGSLSSYGVLFRPEKEPVGHTAEKWNNMRTDAKKIVEEDIYNVIREIQQIARLKS